MSIYAIHVFMDSIILIVVGYVLCLWLLRGVFFVLVSRIDSQAKNIIIAIFLTAHLFMPLLIPAEYRLIRFICGIYLLLGLCKYVDYLSHDRENMQERGRFLPFFLFMECPYTLDFSESFVREDRIKFGKEHLLKMIKGAIQLVAGFMLWWLNVTIELWHSHLILNHCLKMIEFYFIVMGANDFVVVFFRIFGFSVRDIFDLTWKVHKA